MDWSRRETLLGMWAALTTGGAWRGWPFIYDDRALMAAGMADNAVKALLGEHALRYPAMEPQDAYKLCFQRCMGPGHLITEGDALAWLQREAAELAPLPAGAADVNAELLDPGRGLARIHLRPWLAQGRSQEALATAFAETAARRTPEPEVLALELGLVGRLLEKGVLPLAFDRAAWEVFTAPLIQQGLPAVHHSEV